MIGRESCRRLAQQKRAANGTKPKNQNCLIKADNPTLKRHESVRWRNPRLGQSGWNYYSCDFLQQIRWQID